MANFQARFKPGAEIPAFAKAAVLGGHFVKVTDVITSQGDYQVIHCTAGALAMGVAQFDSASASDPADEAARRINVQCMGVARVVPVAGITVGALVASDATGKAITATTGQQVCGQAMNTCLSSDPFVEVRLFSGGLAA